MTPAAGLVVLRVLLGVFFLFQSLIKLPWFLDSGILARQLTGWLDGAAPSAQWYLENIAIPGSPLFARLVPIAEAAAAVALILGAWTRWAAVLTFLMVFNFHFAASRIFQFQFLTNGYALPVLGGLLALAIGGARLPYSLKK